MTESDKISTLSANVTTLLHTLEALSQQTHQLQARLQAEKAITSQLVDKIHELENQNTILTLTKSTLEVSGTTKNAKARINAMIKDIDKTISMLNR